MKKRFFSRLLLVLLIAGFLSSCASQKCECGNNKYKKARYSMVE